MAELLDSIYVKEHVRWRMDEIKFEEIPGDKKVQPSYSETFFDPQLRGATWVGISLSVF